MINQVIKLIIFVILLHVGTKVIKQKIAEKESKENQIEEIQKYLKNSIEKLNQNIKDLENYLKNLKYQKENLEIKIKEKENEFAKLGTKISVIEELFKSEREYKISDKEERDARDYLSMSYNYGAAAYADAHSLYLIYAEKFNAADSKYKIALNNYYLKISHNIKESFDLLLKFYNDGKIMKMKYDEMHKRILEINDEMKSTERKLDNLNIKLNTLQSELRIMIALHAEF